MCAAIVDQILPDGTLVQDVDTSLTPRRRDELIMSALPTAEIKTLADHKVVAYKDFAFLRAQVTHLGKSWPGHKKRIQIGKKWKQQFDDLSSVPLQVKFLGVYTYQDTLIFVDFDPTTYITRKGNNSAAHVSTNDLYQAQKHGVFEKVDKRGNRLTSVRSDMFPAYLDNALQGSNSRFDVFEKFNREFIDLEFIEGLDAVKEMHENKYSQTFQPEWAGFYLEYKFEEFLAKESFPAGIEPVHNKTKGAHDYDLRFMAGDTVEYYGDLKSSNAAKYEAPGNDSASLDRCIKEFGKFWYVVFEHDTIHARDHGDRATIQWNRWKDSVGHIASGRKKGEAFNELSYRTKYKEAVRFTRMMILEVNPANKDVVLKEFNQGVQQDGSVRNQKVSIKKKDLDNFLVYTYSPETSAP